MSLRLHEEYSGSQRPGNFSGFLHLSSETDPRGAKHTLLRFGHLDRLPKDGPPSATQCSDQAHPPVQNPPLKAVTLSWLVHVPNPRPKPRPNPSTFSPRRTKALARNVKGSLAIDHSQRQFW